MQITEKSDMLYVDMQADIPVSMLVDTQADIPVSMLVDNADQYKAANNEKQV